MKMKKDHASRPLWVTAEGKVMLETFSSIYSQANDFLIAIADPVCRPRFIHEYQITSYSLYAAASLGLQTDNIINRLALLSKNELPTKVKELIRKGTEKCGKARLCLKKTRYFIESPFTEVLDEMLLNEDIRESRLDLKPRVMPPYPPDVISNKRKEEFRQRWLATEMPLERDEASGFIKWRQEAEPGIILPGTNKRVDQNQAMGMGDKEEDDMGGTDPKQAEKTTSNAIYSFEISEKSVPVVKKCADEIGFPMLEEYDFKRDTSSPNPPIAPRSNSIRSYQEKSLHKMFGNGRARSGMIVLPCGAGKTLVGITAAATIHKSTLVFCTSVVAVDQWRRQFEKWTTLPSKYVRMFTSDPSHKEPFETEAKVVITTYHMVAKTGKRAPAAQKTMDILRKQEWGLIIMDEVHVAPAAMFRKCVNDTHSRCKLGLTATLVREDEKIDDLFFLVGPKLYEANWLDLAEAGYLATVQCIEVWCEMPAAFYRAYLNSAYHKQLLLYVMNPNKFRACEYLIKRHESRGDKVLVFSDNVYALKKYARELGKPFIHGETGHQERMECLYHFQNDDNNNCLFISKIGDNSIDLPDVNVIIQISSHFSARRQEAQRLGRILRPKSVEHGRYNAFFYTLVSNDTHEMKYASKRQSFLVNQGYAYEVLKDLPGMEKYDLKLGDRASQDELLAEILIQDDAEAAIEEINEDDVNFVSTGQSGGGVTRITNSSLSSRSGADDATYAIIRENAAKYRNRKSNKRKK